MPLRPRRWAARRLPIGRSRARHPQRASARACTSRPNLYPEPTSDPVPHPASGGESHARPQYAKHSLAALALDALMAGCGRDSTAPECPVRSGGTSSDLGAMEASFDSPAMSGFAPPPTHRRGAGRDARGRGGGEGCADQGPGQRWQAGARHYAAAVAKRLRPAERRDVPSRSGAAILDEHLRRHLHLQRRHRPVRGVRADRRPDYGVRFLVYAVNGITGVPVEPLVEVGYADIVDHRDRQLGDGTDRAGFRAA